MRHKIAQIIAILSYYTGIIRLFYYLNRKSKRIVTFHNVMPKYLLPYGKKIGLTDTEESFRFKVKEIRRYFNLNVDLSDKRSVTITFDDGYKNQAEVAGKILKEEGDIPAIIFASGKNIDNTDPLKALVVDLHFHWTLLAPDGVYTIMSDDGSKTDFTLTSSNRDEIWQKVIWPNFTKDGINKGNRSLSQLDHLFPFSDILNVCSPEYLRLRLTGITCNDMEKLQKKGWLIGWHTYEHFPLSKLTESQKKQEIMSAPDVMKKIVFSYPYGEDASVDLESIKIAKDCGYPCAVSNLLDSDKVGNFFLPRFMLDDNRYLLHFELSGLKYFLIRRKLLPIVI